MKERADRVLARLPPRRRVRPGRAAGLEGPSAKDGGELGWLRRGTVAARRGEGGLRAPAGRRFLGAHPHPGLASRFLQLEDRRGGGRGAARRREGGDPRPARQRAGRHLPDTQFIAELKKDAVIDVKMPELKEEPPSRVPPPRPRASGKRAGRGAIPVPIRIAHLDGDPSGIGAEVSAKALAKLRGALIPVPLRRRPACSRRRRRRRTSPSPPSRSGRPLPPARRSWR